MFSSSELDIFHKHILKLLYRLDKLEKAYQRLRPDNYGRQPSLIRLSLIVFVCKRALAIYDKIEMYEKAARRFYNKN